LGDELIAEQEEKLKRLLEQREELAGLGETAPPSA
jgi:predicted component of type VI protein secretion system